MPGLLSHVLSLLYPRIVFKSDCLIVGLLFSVMVATDISSIPHVVLQVLANSELNVLTSTCCVCTWYNWQYGPMRSRVLFIVNDVTTSHRTTLHPPFSLSELNSEFTTPSSELNSEFTTPPQSWTANGEFITIPPPTNLTANSLPLLRVEQRIHYPSSELNSEFTTHPQN